MKIKRPWLRLTLAFPLACAVGGSESPSSRLTAAAVKKDLPIEVELTGVFQAQDKSEIAVEPEEYSGSLIVTKLAAQGTAVQKDDILMKLDKRDVAKAIAQAQTAIDEAKLKLDKAKAELESQRLEQDAGLDRLRKELDLAKRKQEATQKDLAFKQEEAETKIRRGGMGLKDAQVNLDQLKLLYEKKELHTATENILVEREERGIAEQTKDIDALKRRLAHAQEYEYPAEKAKAGMEISQKETDLKKAQIKAKTELNEKEAQASKAERDLKSAADKKKGLEEDVERCTVKSPRAGILFYGSIGNDNPLGAAIIRQTQGELRVGGRITTHQVLLTVASMENLTVNMKVMENDILHIKPGLALTIRPDAFPDLSIPGQVKEVGQVATRSDFFNEAREFSVTGTYEGSFPQLRSGMNCRVTIHADRIPDALQVPVLAVFEDGGKLFCYVQEGAKPVRREVKTGPTNGRAVQILEGLKEGETVLLYDPFRE